VVLLGWLYALTSALCYGVASVLQAAAARSTRAADRVDAMLLVRAARQWRFTLGVLLDLAGFAAQVAALRILPLFVVQVVQAANLAVTAVVAVPALGVRLRRVEWAAVVAVCGGLLLLALAAGQQGSAREPAVFGWTLLAVAVLAAGVGGLVGRGGGAPAALGTVAGVEFTVVAVAARVLEAGSPAAILGDPATWALALAGVVGFLLFTTGLQRGAVTAVTGAVVVAETVLPAVVGVLLLGDRARPGLGWLAATGFVVAVAGAVTLARFGEAAPAGSGRAAGAAPAGRALPDTGGVPPLA
jgi:drug/metabolite transporter (DMT)-like permease